MREAAQVRTHLAQANKAPGGISRPGRREGSSWDWDGRSSSRRDSGGRGEPPQREEDGRSTHRGGAGRKQTAIAGWREARKRSRRADREEQRERDPEVSRAVARWSRGLSGRADAGDSGAARGAPAPPGTATRGQGPGAGLMKETRQREDSTEHSQSTERYWTQLLSYISYITAEVFADHPAALAVQAET